MPFSLALTEGAAATPCEILLLEDDSETARTLCRGLRGRGYEVAIAGERLRGPAPRAEHGFDAAILDLMVPDRQRLRRLRELLRDGGDDARC